MFDNLIGRTHIFEDGDSIRVVQVKLRDADQYWVTYHVQQGPGIPRKLVMPMYEFVHTYGHLFGMNDDTLQGGSS